MEQRLLKLHLTNDQKIKLYQLAVYTISIYVLIFHWNLQYLIIGLGLGWLLYAIAGSVALHKYSAHKTFEPKNRLIKIILLLLATISGLGNSISYSAQHRLHHRHSDTNRDAHNPKGNVWHKIKTWFFYVDRLESINPVIVKDLTSDKDHKWFYKNYGKILLLSFAIASSFGIQALGYFYTIPIWYGLSAMAWGVVIAHTPMLGGYRNYQTNDYSTNSLFWSCFIAGEGLHNNHHGNPYLWNNAISKWEFDLTAPIIKWIGKPNNLKHKPIKKIIKGKHLKHEFNRVKLVLAKTSSHIPQP